MRWHLLWNACGRVSLFSSWRRLSYRRVLLACQRVPAQADRCLRTPVGASRVSPNCRPISAGSSLMSADSGSGWYVPQIARKRVPLFSPRRCCLISADSFLMSADPGSGSSVPQDTRRRALLFSPRWWLLISAGASLMSAGSFRLVSASECP